MIARPIDRSTTHHPEDILHDLPVAKVIRLASQDFADITTKMQPITMEPYITIILKYLPANLWGPSNHLNLYSLTFLPQYFDDWDDRSSKGRAGDDDPPVEKPKIDPNLNPNHFNFGRNKPLRPTTKTKDGAQPDPSALITPILYPVSLNRVDTYYEDLVSQLAGGLFMLLRGNYSNTCLSRALDNFLLIMDKLETWATKTYLSPEEATYEKAAEKAAGEETKKITSTYNFISMVTMCLKMKLQEKRVDEIKRTRSLRNRYHSNIETPCPLLMESEWASPINDNLNSVKVQYFLLGTNVLITNFSAIRRSFSDDDRQSLVTHIEEGIKQKLKKRRNPDFIDKLTYVYNDAEDSLEI